MPFLMLTLCLPASRRGSAGQGFFCEVRQGRGGNSIFLTHLYAQSIVNHTLMIVAYGPELAPYCTHPTIDAAVISLGILVLGLCVFLQEQPLYSFLQKLLHFLHSHQHKKTFLWPLRYLLPEVSTSERQAQSTSDLSVTQTQQAQEDQQSQKDQEAQEAEQAQLTGAERRQAAERILLPCVTPDDPLFPQQWHLQQVRFRFSQMGASQYQDVCSQQYLLLGCNRLHAAQHNWILHCMG